MYPNACIIQTVWLSDFDYRILTVLNQRPFADGRIYVVKVMAITCSSKGCCWLKPKF